MVEMRLADSIYTRVGEAASSPSAFPLAIEMLRVSWPDVVSLVCILSTAGTHID